MCDRLVQFSDWLIRREQGVSQGFTLRVLRLQEAWGCVLLVHQVVLPFGGSFFKSAKQLRRFASNTVI